MDRGYVKIYREILDAGLLQNPTALQVYMYLKLSATHTMKNMVVDGTVYELLPGQFATGRKRIADFLNISEQNVRTAVNLLVKLGFVTSVSTNKCTIFSIIHWDSYDNTLPSIQPAETQSGNQRLTNGQPMGNQRLTTKQERKNERIREEESTPIPFGDCPLQGAVSAAAEDGPFSMVEPEPEYLPWVGGPLPPIEPDPIPEPAPNPEPKPEPEQKPRRRQTKAERQTLTRRPDYTPEFEELWHWYPNKTNKQGAFQTYMTYLEAGELPEHGDFLHRIKMRRHEPDWEKDDGKYVPHMQTWLNRRGWEDGGCFDPDAKPQKFLSPEKLAVRQEIIDYYQEKIDTSIIPLEAQLWRERMEDDLEIEGVAPWQWSN